MYSDSRVYSIFNNYHYDIPAELDPKRINVNAESARAIVDKLAAHYEQPEVSQPKLIVYQYRHIENHPKRPPADPRRRRVLEEVRLATAEGATHIQESTYFLAW